MYEIIIQEELESNAILVDDETITLLAYAVKDVADLFFESDKTELDSVLLLPSKERFFVIRLVLSKHVVTFSGLSLSIAEIELDEYLELLSFGRNNNLPDVGDELKK